MESNLLGEGRSRSTHPITNNKKMISDPITIRTKRLNPLTRTTFLKKQKEKSTGMVPTFWDR